MNNFQPVVVNVGAIFWSVGQSKAQSLAVYTGDHSCMTLLEAASALWKRRLFVSPDAAGAAFQGIIQHYVHYYELYLL